MKVFIITGFCSKHAKSCCFVLSFSIIIFPILSPYMQCFIAILFMFGGTLAQLINGIGVTEWIFYMLVFIALIILRFTKRHERRPFKVSQPSLFLTHLVTIGSLFLLFVFFMFCFLVGSIN